MLRGEEGTKTNAKYGWQKKRCNMIHVSLYICYTPANRRGCYTFAYEDETSDKCGMHHDASTYTMWAWIYLFIPYKYIGKKVYAHKCMKEWNCRLCHRGSHRKNTIYVCHSGVRPSALLLSREMCHQRINAFFARCA